MTKRRPLFSKCQRQVAVFICGLFLLTGLASAGSSKKPAAKPQASKQTKAATKSVRPAGRKASVVAVPKAAVGLAEILDVDTPGMHGHASFYGRGFQGRKTSTGERFDVQQFTAASNHFPLGSMVAVRRLDSDLCAIVKVNDRMHAKHRRRIIDVSLGVAEYLGMVRAGVVLVRVAPMKAGWQEDALESCHAAFEPEKECLACGRPQRLPDFGEAETSPLEPREP